jgi:gamma-glutamyltranspeptidase/glutathione hydrolase
VGAAGGPRIITSTLQAIMNVIDFNMTIGEAVKAPHLNCFTQEQGLELENNFSPDTVVLLEQRGHQVKKAPTNCGLTFFSNGVMFRDGRYLPGHPYRVDGGAGALLADGRKVIDSVHLR